MENKEYYDLLTSGNDSKLSNFGTTFIEFQMLN